MAYNIEKVNGYVVVTTSGVVSNCGRLRILAELKKLDCLSCCKGIIIDHRKAIFNMGLNYASEFSKYIVKTFKDIGSAQIDVILNDQNRFVADLAIMRSHFSGIKINARQENDNSLSAFVAS